MSRIAAVIGRCLDYQPKVRHLLRGSQPVRLKPLPAGDWLGGLDNCFIFPPVIFFVATWAFCNYRMWCFFNPSRYFFFSLTPPPRDIIVHVDRHFGIHGCRVNANQTSTPCLACKMGGVSSFFFPSLEFTYRLVQRPIILINRLAMSEPNERSGIPIAHFHPPIPKKQTLDHAISTLAGLLHCPLLADWLFRFLTTYVPPSEMST